MLDSINAILRERNLLASGEEPGYNITAVTGHVLNIGVYPRSDKSFHVKVKEEGTFPNEYENYCNAWRSFPRYAPEPLGRYFRNDREVIVIRGIPHCPVPPGSVARDKEGLVRHLIGFFEHSDSGARVAESVEPHRLFLRQVLERATDAGCVAILREWLATERIDSLRHIRQHGDFVVNNLGLTDAGLVVFDWEDFGRIRLPGFDLCTLLISDTVFDAFKIGALMGGVDRRFAVYTELLDKSCQVMGLSPDLFRQMIPLYLALFLDLKRDYGKFIGKILSQLIRDLQPLGADGKNTEGRS